MEKKQSSVEWLEKNIRLDASPFEILKIFDQARAMHKEEYIDAWMSGDNDSAYSIKELRKLAEEDYNKIFNK